MHICVFPVLQKYSLSWLGLGLGLGKKKKKKNSLSNVGYHD